MVGKRHLRPIASWAACPGKSMRRGLPVRWPKAAAFTVAVAGT